MMDKSRRKFLYNSSLLTLGAGVPLINSSSQSTSSEEEINIVGPKEGYKPQIGTMLSMMNWMRKAVIRSVEKLTVKELDFLHDENANTIGAMLLHLAATERYYQLHTFDNLDWGKWPEGEKEEWDVAMNLGDEGRKQIKGNSIEFYLEKLEAVRSNTKTEFAIRSDEWLLAVDEDWYWGPTNNYCKWFHVCEHESNHNGQIKFLKSRVS